MPGKPSTCPDCLQGFASLRQHLKKGHRVKNVEEMRTVLRLAAGRYAGKLDCPICKRVGLRRLDKHLRAAHRDASAVQRREVVAEAKRRANLLDLLRLRESNPLPPMVTALDLRLLAEDEVPADVRVGLSDSEDGGQGEPEPWVWGRSGPDAEVGRRHCPRCVKLQLRVNRLKRAVSELMRQPLPPPRPSSLSTGRRKYARFHQEPRHLPAFELIIRQWVENLGMDGGDGDQRRGQNGRQKARIVRNWMVFMCRGGMPTMSFQFLKDLPRMHDWLGTLAAYAVTTQRSHVMTVGQFLRFIQGAGLESVRVSQKTVRGALFFFESSLRRVSRGLIAHRMRVRAAKSVTMVDAGHVSDYLSQAARALPGALDELEAHPCREALVRVYGLLAGYVICLSGHRRGVLQNLQVAEVLDASDGCGAKLVKVEKHKTASCYGHAHLALTDREYGWFVLLLRHRARLPAGKSTLVFANNNCGSYTRLLQAFQEEWAGFGLPGRPTFSSIRSSVSTCVGHNLCEEDQMKVRRLMAHSQTTAQRFYEAENDVRQAWEARSLIWRAVVEQLGQREEVAAAAAAAAAAEGMDDGAGTNRVAGPKQPAAAQVADDGGSDTVREDKRRRPAAKKRVAGPRQPAATEVTDDGGKRDRGRLLGVTYSRRPITRAYGKIKTRSGRLGRS